MSDVLKIAKEGAAGVGRTFQKPDDDWAPMLIYRGDRGISMAALEIGDDKDVLADALVALLRMHHAVEAALVTSAWTVKRDKKEELPERVSTEPDRREVLVISYVNEEIASVCMAEIKRSEDAPPELGEFDIAMSGEEVSGRFIDALRVGIR